MQRGKGSGYSDYYKQTTDGTQTTIATLPIGTNNVLNLKFRFQAVKSDGSKVFGGEVADVFKNSSGTVTRVETDFQNDQNWQTDDASYGIITAISGTNVLVKVTGKAAETLNWHVRIYKL